MPPATEPAGERATVIETGQPLPLSIFIVGLFLFSSLSLSLILVSFPSFLDMEWLWAFGLVLGGFLLAMFFWSRFHLQQAFDTHTHTPGGAASCSQTLVGNCFSWGAAAARGGGGGGGGGRSSLSSFSLGGGRGIRRLWGHRLAVEEGVALSRGQVNLTRLQLLLTDRDFNGNDYELLSQLDEDLHNSGGINPLGATQAELDRLPTYMIETTPMGGKEECHQKCFICLENFVKGDVLRILPCFHQFHQESCADPWLKHKMSCPVCKIMF